MTTTRTLYHVTHRRNVPSILANGLTPKRAKTRWQTIWYTKAEGVAWAIKHVMHRHGYRNSSALVVIKVELPSKHVKGNRWGGVYHSKLNVPVTPEMIYNTNFFTQE